MTTLIDASSRTASAAASGMGTMRRAARRRRYVTNALAAVVSAFLVVWTLIPLYNMVLVALRAESDVFSDHILPVDASLESFEVVITQNHWYLEFFWHQFRNSVFIAAMVTLLVLTIGTFTTFSVGRMRVRNGWLVTNAALLTYMIPASFLAIPFYLIMQHYGLHNNPWSVIAALTTFATPYAIFIFMEYGRSIPLELDESARIDGASPIQIYFRIYLPLMAPALVAVGTYAMLLAWNEYLYQFLLLSQKEDMTVPVALAQFLNSDIAPWNYMMATAIIYALPPIAVYYTFRHRMSSGLTVGGVKG
jgi:multiple sugar transport system permease protein